MARKAPAHVDTTRRLAERAPDGSTGKIFKGAVYTRGMENKLPEGFPEDGPHWEDYEPDDAPAPQGLAAEHEALKQAKMGDSPDTNLGGDILTASTEQMPPNTNIAATRKAGSKRPSSRKGGRK